LAVLGDVHQIDAIIQTNAYGDADSIAGGFPGASATPGASTTATNSALFEQVVRDTAGERASANPDAFPTQWQVSVVEGDVVFLDWITQYSFVSDNDVHVLTATGSGVTVTTGENLGLNHVTLDNLGLYYDVIIIGGSLFDGNVIVQTNVLFDDDALDVLGGSVTGDGSYASGGNVLWNAAGIYNVGATDWQTGLPQGYGDAVDAIENEHYVLPNSFAENNDFQGFWGLKVLYIKGDLYDLRYVEQVNILGDADYVAAVQHDILTGMPDTDWSIGTGSNALVNIASILDYDTMGNTAYVGGQVYSDAILIQAELVDGQDNLSFNPNALASEVIAFLDADGDTPAGLDVEGGGVIYFSAESPPIDVMQSVLA
jgi:hypothetical protein